jgi:hypothetical protein
MDTLQAAMFELHTATKDYLNEGIVWIGGPTGKTLVGKRPIVRIKYEGKQVFCEALYAERFFLKNWDDNHSARPLSDDLDKSRIFISAWYRRLLGIPEEKIEKEIRLDVKALSRINLLLALLWKYPRQHPNVVVLTANMVGVIALGLGFIGVGMGSIALTKDTIATGFVMPAHNVGLACFGLGVLITLCGIWGLLRK